VVIQATNENGDLRGVVAIGSSAGGVEALSNLVARLSADLPYAYPMALHIPAGAPSILARIVNRNGPLFRHYTALAEESEGALTVLGARLSASGPRSGEAGDAAG
jgi:CheB methylesterase